jgi:hypothetical protein
MATPHQAALSYLTFGQLWSVISDVANWPLFEPYFPPKSNVEVKIEEVKAFDSVLGVAPKRLLKVIPAEIRRHANLVPGVVLHIPRLRRRVVTLKRDIFLKDCPPIMGTKTGDR